MEYDPYHNFRLNESKIIIGSFPTWSLTTPDSDKGETEELKLKERRKNGDLQFFYGSSTNVFWKWYSTFIDESIQPTDLNAIKRSLTKNEIGITNLITSAVRKGRSSFDYDLSQRTYNFAFFKYPQEAQKLKLLCTSKAVMNEMLLSGEFWKKHTMITENGDESVSLTSFLLKDVDGAETALAQPICRCLNVADGGKIECVSIPSPGSPFRGLHFFGKRKEMSSNEFLRRYLGSVFSWFKS